MRIYLFIFILCLPVRHFQACSCHFIDNFCGTVTDENGELHENLGIVWGTVQEAGPAGVWIEPKASLNSYSPASRFFVHNGNGATCTVSTGAWRVGDEFVLAIPSADSLYLNSCGVSFLPVIDGQVTGSVSPGISRIAPDQLARLSECGGRRPLWDAEVHLSPNPVISKLKVSVISEEPLTGAIAVFDAAGRRIQGAAGLDFNQFELDVTHWSAGVYSLELSALGERRLVRFVVMSN